MSYMTVFVKHPHGTLISIPAIDAPAVPPVPPVATGIRRPAVALLDSAVGSHPWLEPPASLTSLTVPIAGRASSDVSAQEPSPHPDANRPAGPIDITQHGTFDAGIIRRFAPGAEIISVAVMDSTGNIEPSDVLSALAAIHDLLGSETGRFVDVVCLPFGYVQGRATPEHMRSEKVLLDKLAELGVIVVAAAGNLGTEQPVYPAAFADQAPPLGPALLSIGALNPDRSRASYSSRGHWVKHWEVGLVDSIVADPPDGYARGEGTSFAATTVSAQLAGALSDIGKLNETTPGAARARAAEALTHIGVHP